MVRPDKVSISCIDMVNGNIHYSGPEELKGFANNPAVKKAFVASVFGLHSVGPNNDKSGN